MKPILYSSTETSFTTNGIGILGDCISCDVTEERNGLFELEMRYPISGIHYGEISQRSIISARSKPGGTIQPFRVYEISRPIGGVVTVYAKHLAYDLSGIPVSPFTSSTASSAMSGLKSNAAVTCPFTFSTDKTTSAKMTVSVPKTIWELLGGSEGGILDVYGGEYEFDRWTVKLHAQRGYDRGVTIRYGKNLTDLRQDENCASVYTGVYPYWADADGNLTTLPEKIVNASGNFDFTRIKPVDFSMDFEEQPTEATLRAAANAYITNNQIGVPNVSIKVSFIPLDQTEEYRDIAPLERVDLCDVVSVSFPELGVSAKAKVIRTVYDVLLDRYSSVELGDARDSVAKIIVTQEKKLAQQEQDIASKPGVSDVNNIASGYADSALESANGYTDTSAQNTLTSANGYTDTAMQDAIDAAKQNTALQIENYDEYMTQLEIFNRLTNNGATQGIFMENGKLYINMDYAHAGTIDATYINLNGKFYVFSGDTLGGYLGYMTGYDGNSTTYGVGLGASGGNYIIVTNGGARLQGGGNSVYATSSECGVSGKLRVYGDLVVDGSIKSSGDISTSGNVSATGTVTGSNITSS